MEEIMTAANILAFCLICVAIIPVAIPVFALIVWVGFLGHPQLLHPALHIVFAFFGSMMVAILMDPVTIPGTVDNIIAILDLARSAVP